MTTMNDDWGRNGEEIDSDNYDDDDESVEGDDMDNWGEGDGDDNDNISGAAEMYNSEESDDWVPRRQKGLIRLSLTPILLNNHLIRAYRAAIKNPLYVCANNS
jgi:hypothetical protein